MYSMTRTVPIRKVLSLHAPTLAVSILIAEVFYKLGSFTLECLAFLATWYVLDASVHTLNLRFNSWRSSSPD